MVAGVPRGMWALALLALLLFLPITISLNIISTIAGTGSAAYSGDGGQATSATLNTPYDVALDSVGMM